jgi:hypothetical protein
MEEQICSSTRRSIDFRNPFSSSVFGELLVRVIRVDRGAFASNRYTTEK